MLSLTRSKRYFWGIAAFSVLLIVIPKRSIGGVLFFDGQVRERFEALSGLNKKAYGNRSMNAKGKIVGKANDKLLLQRVIAGFTYQQSKSFVYHLHLYDARVWGWSLDEDDFVKNKGTRDEYVMDPDEEYLELYDANVKFSPPFLKGISIQLGRQKIWYGDKRIFGPGGWGNSIGWLWDAARVSFKTNSDFVDAWYGQTKTKDLILSAFFINMHTKG